MKLINTFLSISIAMMYNGFYQMTAADFFAWVVISRMIIDATQWALEYWLDRKPLTESNR